MYYKLLIFCLLISSATGYVLWQKHQVTKYKNLYAKVQVDNVTLTGNIESFKAALSFQNSKLEEAKKTSDAKQKEMDALSGEIAKKEKLHKAELKKMLAEPAPLTCEDSLIYLNKVIGQVKWSKN